MSIQQPDVKGALRRILREVERPARYLGGERHSVVKDHAAVPMRVVMAFPDTYEIGMSHLGLRILYSVLNGRDDMLLERCFAPWPDMERALRENGLPLFSLETRTPLAEFDVIGFSLQYELSFTNVLQMLDLAGLPLRAADRDESHPLVVAGGPVAFSPEPVADFIDAFLIGDGEEAFPELLETHLRLKKELAALRSGDLDARRQARARVLRGICRVPGVYVPSLYHTAVDPRTGLGYVTPRLEFVSAAPPFPIRRAVLEDLDRFPFPAETIVPHPEIVHDRVSVEIARGCTEGCRFCQAGTIYRPVRERSAESIVKSALCGLQATGYNEINLTSLSPADYSSLPALVEKVMDTVADAQVGLAVSSLRPYGLTEDLARQISRVTRTGFTIAPDAGTQRLRDVINKGVTEEHILTAARNAFREGWSVIKLYFIIGLPTETEDDLEAMVDLAQRIHRIGREELGRRNSTDGRKHARVSPRIHMSASSLVPKPHTPFQWMGQETVEALYAKQRFIAERVGNRNIRFKRHHVETSRLEALLSRGDRRVGAVVERAYRMGCRFDGWTEQMNAAAWERAMEDEGLAWEPFLADLPLDALLPWDHVDTTVAKAFQLREWKRALAGALTPACEKPYRKFNRPVRESDKLVCYDCGCDCDLTHIRDLRVENHRRLLQLLPRERLLMPPAADSPKLRYRLLFAKRGPACYLAHLDLMRVFMRAFRRAGVALRMSQGYNPKPLLTFGSPLALGVEGREEALDFTLGAAQPPESMVRRLNATLPEGIVVLAIDPVPVNAPPLAATPREAHYTVRVPLRLEPSPVGTGGERGSRQAPVSAMPFNEESALRAGAGPSKAPLGGPPVDPNAERIAGGGAPRETTVAWHREQVEALIARPVHFVPKTRKGRRVEVDLKRHLEALRVEEAGEDARGGAASGEVVLRFVVRFHQRAAVRPDEVLTGIYGFVPRGCTVIRERMVFADAPTDPAPDPRGVDQPAAERPLAARGL